MIQPVGSAQRHLRLCFVAPMLGRHPGYVPSQGEKLAALLQKSGYDVIAVSSKRNRYLRFLDIVVTLLRKRRSIDLLIIGVYSGPSFVVEDIASWIGKRAGIPMVMTLHGGAMPEFMVRFPRWSKRVLGRANALVAQSEYLVRAMNSIGLSATVIPNVIDLPAYPYQHRSTVRPRLFWMRAFHPIYNPKMALKVLVRVRARVADATLVMAGQDDGWQIELERLAGELGLAEVVRFPGFLDFTAKVHEGGSADIFINTTHIDNRPVSVVEACAMGLPVVSTNVGGVPDLLRHEETGLLVADDDVEAMAAAIIRLVEEPELASRLSLNGPLVARASAPDRVLSSWQELLAQFPADQSGDRRVKL